MRLISFNVNGINAILKKNLKEDFNSLNPDIFAMQEIKLSENSHDSFPFCPPGYEAYWTVSKVKKGYSGVAMLSKIHPLNVHYGLEDNKYDDEGRVLTLEFDDFYFMTIYSPNSQDELRRLPYRLEFQKDLESYINSLNKPVIICGDLNVAHNPIDIKRPKANENSAGYSLQERKAMDSLLSSGLKDTFRELHPQEVKYSWWSYMFNARKTNAGWRLDYFLVSDCLLSKVKDADILNDIYGSDHCPILLDIDL